MKIILKSLKQESTWRGIIAVAMAFGITIDPSMQSAIITIGLSLIGSINILKKD
jgi:hypothetical protein